MKKLLICLILLALAIPGFIVSAATPGARVYVRIEGATQTVAEGSANAYTFREALEALAKEYALTLTFEQGETHSRLYTLEDPSVLAETPPAEIQGEWLGFIQRGDDIIRQEAYLDLTLANGDEVVLYFGDPGQTQVITHFTCDLTAQGLAFSVGAAATDWTEEDGVWQPQSSVNPVEGVDIRLVMPDGTEATVQTDHEGRALLPIGKPGIAAYYAEGFRADAAPLIARTSVYYTLCGFASPETYVTRAQAVALLVNVMQLEKDRTGNTFFEDINPETAFYDEIITAAARGLVAGYGDGTFGPESPVTLMQLCVLAARLFPAVYEEGPALVADGLPEWAAAAAGGLYGAGWLMGIDTDGPAWSAPVMVKTLAQLYENIR